ncbi:MAG: MFS transporter [Anaerolineales bacterium]|nr:MFS transporter [Anaerolineales bacterium]
MLAKTAATIRFYGWVIVAVSFVSLTVAFGVRLSFTVFFVALIDEFGWLRADTAFIFSVSMIVFAATSILAGMALDRWGVRLTFGLGALLMALGLLLSSRVQAYWQLLLAYGVIASLGITILGLGPQASVIARWFRQRRGLAIGIAFSGTGIGVLLIIPAVEYLTSVYGWRAAYLALGVLSLIMAPLIVFLMRLNPSDLGLEADGITQEAGARPAPQASQNWTMRRVARSPAFWLLLVAAVGAIGPVRMLTVHQLAIIEAAGVSRSFAALVIGASGAVTALAFIFLGALSDRIDRRLVYFLGALSLLAAIAILSGIRGPQHVLWMGLFAFFLGLGEGSRSSLVTAVASDLFPGDALGAVNGTVGAAFGLGAAFFPWFAGFLFDVQGKYTLGFVAAGATVLVSAFALALAPRFQKIDG